MRKALRAIAVAELVGGVFTVAMVLFLTVQGSSPNLWLSALGTGGALSTGAGVSLWRGTPDGLRRSVVVQIVQAVQVALPGLALVVVLGPNATVGFNGGRLDAHLGLQSELAFAFWDHGWPARLQINVLAIVFLLILRRAIVEAGEASRPGTARAPAA
jgi:hypothetical protein